MAAGGDHADEREHEHTPHTHAQSGRAASASGGPTAAAAVAARRPAPAARPQRAVAPEDELGSEADDNTHLAGRLADDEKETREDGQEWMGQGEWVSSAPGEGETDDEDGMESGSVSPREEERAEADEMLRVAHSPTGILKGAVPVRSPALLARLDWDNLPVPESVLLGFVASGKMYFRPDEWLTGEELEAHENVFFVRPRNDPTWDELERLVVGGGGCAGGAGADATPESSAGRLARLAEEARAIADVHARRGLRRRLQEQKEAEMRALYHRSLRGDRRELRWELQRDERRAVWTQVAQRRVNVHLRRQAKRADEEAAERADRAKLRSMRVVLNTMENVSRVAGFTRGEYIELARRLTVLPLEEREAYERKWLGQWRRIAQRPVFQPRPQPCEEDVEHLATELREASLLRAAGASAAAARAARAEHPPATRPLPRPSPPRRSSLAPPPPPPPPRPPPRRAPPAPPRRPEAGDAAPEVSDSSGLLRRTPAGPPRSRLSSGVVPKPTPAPTRARTPPPPRPLRTSSPAPAPPPRAATASAPGTLRWGGTRAAAPGSGRRRRRRPLGEDVPELPSELLAQGTPTAEASQAAGAGALAGTVTPARASAARSPAVQHELARRPFVPRPLRKPRVRKPPPVAPGPDEESEEESDILPLVDDDDDGEESEIIKIKAPPRQRTKRTRREFHLASGDIAPW